MSRQAEVRHLLESAVKALEDGDLTKARGLLTQVLRLDAQNEWAWRHLSRTMKTARGIAWCLERAYAINPDRVETRRLLHDLSESEALETPEPYAGETGVAGAGEPVADAEARAPGPGAAPPVPAPARAGVAASLAEAGLLLDILEPELRATEDRSGLPPAELEQLRREAAQLREEVTRGAVATRQLETEMESVAEAQRELASESADLRKGGARTAEQLSDVADQFLGVAAQVAQTAQASDETVVRLEALESRVGDLDAGLAEIRGEARAAAAQQQSDSQSVIAAQQRLVGELDELRTETRRTADQLGTVEEVVSQVKDELAKTNQLGHELEEALDSLHPALLRVANELKSLNERTTDTEKTIAGLVDQVTALERDQAAARGARRRRTVLPILAVGLGMSLLTAAVLQAYPYLESRLVPKPAVRQAQAGADLAWGAGGLVASPSPSTAESWGQIEGTVTPDRDVTSSPVATPTPVATVTSIVTAAQPSEAVSSARAGLAASATATPSPTPSVPTRLSVAGLAIDAPVVPVSWQSAEELGKPEGAWEVPGERTVGWHDESAPLGAVGNAVLNGHNTTGGEVFRDLYKIEAGDVITAYSNGVGFAYVVSETLIVAEEGQPLEVRKRNASYMEPTEDERLTIMTCHPYGSLRNRLIVIAQPERRADEEDRLSPPEE